MLHLSCGNKVSPASLLNNNNTSMDTGVMSGTESQHSSQVSLFSGSEGPSSLELFSQPLAQTQSNTAVNCVLHDPAFANSKLATVENTVQPSQVSDGKKYYMKYLASTASKERNNSTNGKSTVMTVPTDSMASKLAFDAWKEHQQEKLERKGYIEDINRIVNASAAKLDKTIASFQEEIERSIAGLKGEIMSQKDTNNLMKLQKDNEEERMMIEGVKRDLAQQKVTLNLLSHQMSSFTSSITASGLSEQLISLSATLQRRLTCVATTATQTSPSLSLENNMHCCSSHASTQAIDQAVPAIVPLVQCSIEESDLYKEVLQDSQHTKTTTTTLPSQTTCFAIVSRSTTDGKQDNMSGEQCNNSIEPSPVYDLDLSRLPFFIKNELAETVHIERKVSYGKRQLEQSPLDPRKTSLPHKSVRSRKVITPRTDYSSRRRSKRRQKTPTKFCYDSSSEEDEDSANFLEDKLKQVHQTNIGRKIQRRTSLRIQSRTFSHRASLVENSPMNALSDTLYCGGPSVQTTTTTRSNFQNMPLEKEKFHRSDESVKRRLKVISNMSDSGMVLREIKDSILNCQVVSSEPSP